MNAEKMNFVGAGTVQKLTRLLAAPTIDPSQRAARIQAVEKDIVLPLRGLIIAILAYYFFFSGWFDVPGAAKAANLDWSLRYATRIKEGFLIYAVINALAGFALVSVPHLTLRKIEWIVFGIGLLDALLMGMLVLLSDGFDSPLYWVFPALILHNALAIPVAFPQLLINLLVALAFMTGGVFDRNIIVPQDMAVFMATPAANRGEPPDLRREKPAERLIVLAAWALCCYGIQVLFEKQKRAEAEATEFAVRQERLHTAGRLAAEIAHQIKNPLGIITNAAFCLQREMGEGDVAVDEQIQIIREEVERADQIITELMGYAQLAEGVVERLEVADEVDNALLEVFPPAAKYRVEIVKDYAPSLPSLLMQKRHLSGVLVNLLQNAREAMNGVGRIEVAVRYGENDSVVICIADNGSGISPGKIDKIFEAYFTTREKGTGLGLAIVKHNVEMYGGAVNVQSELGTGTRFTIEFPARILMRLSK
ncbi:MAG TPA: ATP-binding protein [Candidatus Saccharimonadales bacterium]|nr:ATP-binding protein [Candidatus Saccharimonadales bacterium]